MKSNFVTAGNAAMCAHTFARFLDIAVVLAMSHIVFYLRTGISIEKHYYLLIALAILFMQVVFAEFGVYREMFNKRLREYLPNLFVAWSAVCVVLVLILYFTKSGEMISRIWMASWYLSCFACFAAVHLAIRGQFFSHIKRHTKKQKIILFGGNRLASKLMKSLDQNPVNNYRIACVFDNDLQSLNRYFSDVPRRGSLEDGLSYIREHQSSAGDFDPEDAAEVWVTLPLKQNQYLETLLTEVQDTTYSVRYVPDMTGINLLHSHVDKVEEFTVFTLIDSPIKGAGMMAKFFQDKLLALLFLLLASPVMLLIALLVKLESPGPVLFKQTRYGIDGRRIKVWKFRSMLTCEDTVVRQAQQNDARVTRVGRFIRRYSLDELPQLLNVLTGQMSIVGPRPHAVNHNEEYRRKINGYMLRHKLKPGITGWAQVNGWRGETDVLDKMKKRVEYDLFYIRNWSILLDFKIIIMTVKSIFIGQNAH